MSDLIAMVHVTVAIKFILIHHKYTVSELSYKKSKETKRSLVGVVVNKALFCYYPNISLFFLSQGGCIVARLPEVGGDESVWGSLLNEYLRTAHNDDGTIKDSIINASKVSDGAISTAKLADGSVTAVKLAASAPTTGQVLGYSGTALTWSTPSSVGTVPDATGSTKGVMQIAGDLGGTASSPTVPGLASKANDNAVVHLTGNESIAGVKNFTGTLQSAGQAVVATNDARLSDQRVPANTSVTPAKLNAANAPTTGQVLGYNGTQFNWTAAASGGNTTLAGVTDVALTTPSANQFLGYNPGTSKWVNSSLNGISALSTGGGVETLNVLGNRTGATTLNLATGNVFSITLTGATNFTITGATAGAACSFGLYLKQDATGSRLVTWPASVKWPGGTAPTLTTTAAATDIIVLESIDGGATWFGSLVGADYR
jgi:hypothetical protein